MRLILVTKAMAVTLVLLAGLAVPGLTGDASDANRLEVQRWEAPRAG
jgi:hypothetical protein